MNEKTSKFRWHDRRWTIVAAVVALPLLGWGLLHPEFRPDLNTIDPSIRRELAKTGFAQTTGVSSALRESAYTMGKQSWKMTVKEEITSIDGPITEKRAWRRGAGLPEQTSGLYVGPIILVHYYRSRLPLIGDLLPYQFWSSRHLTKFVLEETDRFPSVKGGRLRARVTYEERYAGGELVEREDRRLECDVTSVVDAASVHKSLSGSAARVECREELEPNGRQLGPSNPETMLLNQRAYSHWYIVNRGWSIALEGEDVYQLSDTVSQAYQVGQRVNRIWKSRLVSFESTMN